MTDTWLIVLTAVLCCVPGGVFLQQDKGVQCVFEDNGDYDCSGRNFASVPENIPGNVTVLYLNRNNLTVLGNDELLNKGGANIEKLFLRQNAIAELKDEAFNGLTNLSVLHLRGNNITVFNKDIISGNLHVTQLNLRGNPIQLPDSETEPILNSASLEYLDLMECNLSRISEGLFSGVPNLRGLSLGRNRLTTVNWLAVNFLSELKRIDFGHNEIRHLPCEPEMVLALIEMRDGQPEIARANIPVNNATQLFLMFGNPLACDCCTSFVSYWLEHKSLKILGDCSYDHASPDIRNPEVLKQCYITVMEAHNRTVGELH